MASGQKSPDNEYLCCKCFNEFDIDEAIDGKLCPVCDYPMEPFCPKTPCEECLKAAAEQRYLIAQVMTDEGGFATSGEGDDDE